MQSVTFALYFGNRGFFPETLIASARAELTATVQAQGYGALMPDVSLTRYGAVETAEEGRAYAAFLAENRGRYQGVILCLPNFGDENGAIAALRDCGVPILILAYPDEQGKLDFAHRRDSFCGKFSIMYVFCQYGLPFTAWPPHTLRPDTAGFAAQLREFAAVCRVAGGMRRLTVGAVGARTTAFKTVRFDELALQKYGITVEALDLSEVLRRVGMLSAKDDKVTAKSARLTAFTDCSLVPADKLETLAKLSVALDDIAADYAMDCLSLRCWNELEQILGVAPCVLLGLLNDTGMAAACELDVGNAVAMHALKLASGEAAACLDWNNNYGSDPDRCILFHCGPVAQSLMEGAGRVTDHKMFAKSYGAGCGWGCNEGRIAAFPMTYASSKTEDGKVIFYLGEGEFTGEPIEEGFFGCGGVARIPGLQGKLLTIGRRGFRHHVSITRGSAAAALREAFTTYLGYDLIDFDAPQRF